MTDDGFDERLHRMLADRARTVEPSLTGPSLRADAQQRRRRPTRLAAVLGAAAAVAAVGVAAALVGGSDGRPGPTAPAGHSSTTPTPSVSRTLPPPVTTPVAPPSTTPAAPSPSRTSAPSASSPTVRTEPVRPTGSAGRSGSSSIPRPTVSGRTTPARATSSSP